MLWKSIIAAIVVISGSTFLAYKLSVFLGISVERRTWILCALMAMVCSFIAAPSTMYFPVSHLSVIVFAVIASTIFITYYNYRQTSGKDKKNKAAAVQSIGRRRRPLKVLKAAAAPRPAGRIRARHATKAQGGVFAALFAATPEAQDESLALSVSRALQEDEERFLLPVQMPCPAEKAPLGKKLARKIVKKPVPSCLQEAPRISFYGFCGHLPPQEKEACRAQLLGKTPDEIVDIACSYWRQRRLYRALYCLFAALRHYGDDPAALFICIEISNIYKSFGAYDLAAASLRASLYLPAVRENAALQSDLKEQIAYLHRLIAVLKLAGIPQIPIERVPGAFLRRADAAFSDSDAAAAAQDSSMEAI